MEKLPWINCQEVVPCAREALGKIKTNRMAVKMRREGSCVTTQTYQLPV